MSGEIAELGARCRRMVDREIVSSYGLSIHVATCYACRAGLFAHLLQTELHGS